MEGETLPRFDSKSRLFANVKYPREHRIPGYAQKAVFFYLEIVTRCASLQYYTVLVYVSVLVGAVHLRLFPIFPHVFRCQAHLLDTIYCIHVSHCTYIECTLVPARSARCPCCSLRLPARARARACVCVCVGVWPCSLRSLSLLLALLAVAVVPPARSLPADRRTCSSARARVRPPARACVCAPADAWSTVDFLVRRPCAACLACPCVCSLRSPPVRGRACFRCSRLYGSFSRSARRVVRSAHSTANFFEIVFKPSISVQLSSAGMGGAA